MSNYISSAKSKTKPDKERGELEGEGRKGAHVQDQVNLILAGDDIDGETGDRPAKKQPVGAATFLEPRTTTVPLDRDEVALVDPRHVAPLVPANPPAGPPETRPAPPPAQPDALQAQPGPHLAQLAALPRQAGPPPQPGPTPAQPVARPSEPIALPPQDDPLPARHGPPPAQPFAPIAPPAQNGPPPAQPGPLQAKIMCVINLSPTNKLLLKYFLAQEVERSINF